MRAPDLVFVDWARPTAESAARWLLRRASAEDRIDLSDHVVLVPTSSAGRRLREALVRTAEPRGILSPRILTPARWLEPPDETVATGLESRLALLHAIDRQPLPAIFPKGKPFQNLAERSRFADIFLRLRATLAEAAHSIGSARRQLADRADADLWQDLEDLEGDYQSGLRRLGRTDRESARLRRTLDDPPQAIVLVGVADLSPLAARFLGELPGSTQLHAIVPASMDALETFDVWGRPLETAWQSDPGWENFDGQVRLCARATDAARDLLAVCPATESPRGDQLEIGLLDRDAFPRIRQVLERRGASLHDPEGRPLAETWLPRLLRSMGAFLAEPRFDRAIDLLRNGAITAWLRARSIDVTASLTEADAVLAGHFPSTIQDALKHCGQRPHLRAALDRLATLRQRLVTGLDPAPWEEIAEALQPAMSEDDLEATSSALGTLADGMHDAAALAKLHRHLSTADWLELLAGDFSGRRHQPSGPPDAVQASGWLELQWSGAPHVVLVGFNRGLVPAAIPTEPFLPASQRGLLGLRTDAQRTARDAYFLARLLAQRANGRGRVDVQVLQIAADDSPLQPSPLLFQGSGDALAGRVRRLFVEPRSPDPDPAWTAGWHYAPPVVELPRRLRVTGFSRYLDCPFEFYLHFGLRMETVDPAPAEMDARVFGSLVHNALEAFARDEEARALHDAKRIQDALADFLDADVARNFSTPPSLALTIQIDAARRRLFAFAEAQALERADGWRIEHAEVSFADMLGGEPWRVGDWEITGRIDRIDIHEKTGIRRVLDYKTSDRADLPEGAHLRRTRSGIWPPAYAQAAGSGAGKVWVNLQLPLYRELLIAAGEDPDTIRCGYVNLPKAVAGGGVAEWRDFDPELAASAQACMRGVLADIERGHFWPPNPRPRHPELTTLFEPSPDRVIAPESPLRLKTG